jgi:hypothetical protein
MKGQTGAKKQQRNGKVYAKIDSVYGRIQEDDRTTDTNFNRLTLRPETSLLSGPVGGRQQIIEIGKCTARIWQKLVTFRRFSPLTTYYLPPRRGAPP